jgi:hypothetical protein
MTILRVLLPTLALAIALPACKNENRRDTAVPAHEEHKVEYHRDHEVELAGREVVPNYEAQVGDVTVCPYSGRKFEVAVDSPRLMWKGKSWVLCSDEPMAEIQASPDKYLGKYLDESDVELDEPKPATLPPDLDE